MRRMQDLDQFMKRRYRPADSPAEAIAVWRDEPDPVDHPDHKALWFCSVCRDTTRETLRELSTRGMPRCHPHAYHRSVDEIIIVGVLCELLGVGFEPSSFEQAGKKLDGYISSLHLAIQIDGFPHTGYQHDDRERQVEIDIDNSTHLLSNRTELTLLRARHPRAPSLAEAIPEPLRRRYLECDLDPEDHGASIRNVLGSLAETSVLPGTTIDRAMEGLTRRGCTVAGLPVVEALLDEWERACHVGRTCEGFGVWLQDARFPTPLTVVAEHLGVALATVAQWHRGEVLPSFRLAPALGDALEQPLRDVAVAIERARRPEATQRELAIAAAEYTAKCLGWADPVDARSLAAGTAHISTLLGLLRACRNLWLASELVGCSPRVDPLAAWAADNDLASCDIATAAGVADETVRSWLRGTTAPGLTATARLREHGVPMASARPRSSGRRPRAQARMAIPGLRAERVEAGLTQADLARAIGVSQQLISQWESGSAPTTSEGDIDRLAAALGTDTSALLVDRPVEVVDGLTVGREQRGVRTRPPGTAIARLICDAVTAGGHSFQWLADSVGISPGHLSQVLSDSDPAPRTQQHLSRSLEALGLQPIAEPPPRQGLKGRRLRLALTQPQLRDLLRQAGLDRCVSWISHVETGRRTPSEIQRETWEGVLAWLEQRAVEEVTDH